METGHDLKKEDNFVGRHLLLDVQVNSTKGIGETSYLYNVLEDLTRILNMTLVYPPIVARFPWASNELESFVKDLERENIHAKTMDKMRELINVRNKEDAGISGICIWLESHAAIHTWTDENFFSFDAYSCKEFDANSALEFLLSHFDVKAYNGLNIIRTINEPQKIEVIRG